jgi:hypothetical protein
MFRDEFSIQFHGFHPSEETESMVRERLGLLHEKAPYGATVSARFFRHDGHLKATITINSHAGRFFAVSTGEHLREVIQNAVDQIHKQMERSKTLRLRQEGLRDFRIKVTDHDQDFGSAI